MKNKRNVNPLLHALLPLGITIVYVLLGHFCKSGWAIGWILYLLIPIVETLVNAINHKDASEFAYPVLVTAIFLFTGFQWGLWHPMWVLFVSIPAYYAICDAVKKKNVADVQQDYNTVQPEQAPYQPPVAPQQHKKSNATPIIISVIISVTVIIVVFIVSVFSWLGGNFKLPVDIYLPFAASTEADDSYISGNAELDTEGIGNIDVEWVDGNVDIDYYDGDKIIIAENRSTEKTSMCYKIDNGTLHICEYKNGVKKGISNIVSKDLTIQLPNDFETDVIELEVVSANINADHLNTKGIEIETVSSTANLSFASQPQSIEVESVSGDVNLEFEEEISGYVVSKDSVSGSFRANDFDNAMSYGDGFTKIDFESVSGNLIINK